jgi:hypothetical protein
MFGGTPDRHCEHQECSNDHGSACSRVMDINWTAVEACWEVQHEHESHCILVKVQTTVEPTTAKVAYENDKVRLDMHYTEKERLIGYVLHYEQASHSGAILPRHWDSKFYVALFYSPVKDLKIERRDMCITYHDLNVRLLTFESVDYMLVMRWIPDGVYPE